MKKKLLQTILVNTKSGSLVWKLANNLFNKETEHHYECTIKDGSKVEMEIRLDNDLKWKESYSIWINNPVLVNGKLSISRTECDEVVEISKLVYLMYIKPTLKPKAKTEEQILEDIMNAIPSKEERRDQKISEILETEKTRTIKVDVDTDSDKPELVKKSSKWWSIFE